MRNNTLVVWLWISNFYNKTQQTFAACYYAATQYGRKFPLNKKGYFGNLISLKTSKIFGAVKDINLGYKICEGWSIGSGEGFDNNWEQGYSCEKRKLKCSR